MKFNNENETKDLGFGAASEATPVTPTPKPEGNQATFIESTPAPKNAEADTVKPTPVGGNGGGNSFYDRQQDNSASTKWYKDWRGKTLGLSLAALLLIGGGIPAGMALGGYWHDGGEANLVDQTELDTASDLTNDEIERIYDKAIITHYDDLVTEGYITQKAHDNKIEDAEENADDTIDNEKETLKANYGNTWEEEWDNSLKEKGFHTVANGGEEEYKDSMISSTLEESIRTTYTTKTAITSTVLEGDFKASDYDFASTAPNTKGKYYYVENKTPSQVTRADGSYSYTPEDLMNLYVLTYEPIVLNNSLMPFTPVEGANDTEANIQGDNIYMSNDNVKSAWSFAKAEAEGTGAAAINYGGIQSRYGIDLSAQGLSTEANIAVDLFIANNDGVSLNTEIKNAGSTVGAVVNAGFANVPDLAGKTFDAVTSTDISNMNSNDVQLFSKGVSTSLKGLGLLTSDNGTVRNFATTGLFNIEGAANSSVSFVSTNGLNNVGISFESQDVVVEQLDNYAGVTGAVDVGLVSSFNTWFSSAFKYITIADYLTDPIDPAKGWFDGGSLAIELNDDRFAEIGATIDEEDIVAIAGEGATAADATEIIQYLFGFILTKDLVLNTTNSITTSYNSAKSFVDTNWEDYNSVEFELGVGADIVSFMSNSTMSGFAYDYLMELIEAPASIKNEVINKGGDE